MVSMPRNGIVIPGSNATDAVAAISVTQGNTAAGNNFGEQLLPGNDLGPQLSATSPAMDSRPGQTDDMPLAGMTVKVYRDATGSGTVGVLDAGDVLIAIQITTAAGLYSFAELAAGPILRPTDGSHPGMSARLPAVTTYYTVNLAAGMTATGQRL